MKLIKTKNILIAAVITLIGIGLLSGVSNYKSTNSIAGIGSKLNAPLQKVTVGFQPSPPMAILMVAKDKGFFEKEGLDVELKEFTAGKFALAAFFGGSLDFSISGDVPPALAALQGNQFIVPAQIVKRTKNEVRVVAKKDGDLKDAESYFKAKKRKLATSAGGGPEFFTYEFLNKLGIQKDQIEIISQKPEDMVAALVNGSVDAIAIFDPVAYVAEKQMGDKAITFTDETVYSELYIIEAHPSAKDDTSKLDKFLKGLVAAEYYLKTHSDEAKDIVAKYTKLDRKTIDGIWGNSEFGVSITPELLTYWKKEAEWAKVTGKVSKESEVPDFQTFIWSEPLRKIAPDAVNQ